MIGLRAVKSVFTILQSENSPMQIAGGVAIGLFMGFSPFNGPQNYLLMILLFFLNVNVASATVATALFSGLAALLDPVAHKLGFALLVSNDSLTPFWTALYNLPVVPFTRFNNTVVLGSFVLALILVIPVIFLTRAFILYYRAHWRERVGKVGVVKWLSGLNTALGIKEKL
ncbi:MAG: TIGR03546 family protein [candidate division FCPU426 bacterium]